MTSNTLNPFAAIALAAALVTGCADATGVKPNVVLVITDDQGYGDLSCHGNPVLKTPNLDRLHDESVRLVDYHVAPTCSPTRAALVTGRWTNRTGVWHTSGGRSLLPETEVTMGRVFLDAGYATGMFGKWHMGDNYPFRPEDHGFSEVMRHGGGGVGQTPDYWDNSYFDGTYFHNSEPEAVQGYCTDVWFEYARRFIRSQKAAGTPFLAYISTNAPHWPMHAPPEFAAPYVDRFGTHVGHFLGMIANIDHNVGRLRAFLEREGLAENTIFIFTSDNGTGAGHTVFNAGMRGRKQSEYDGGHRVPLFIHWPAGGLVGGRDVEPITAHVDMVPTLIDLAGVSPPTAVRFDGLSIRPLLESRAGLADASWPDRILVTDSQRVIDPIKWRRTAVMTSRWRLVNGSELYDIRQDPGQEIDVAGAEPEVVSRLRDFYDAWWEELEPTFQNVPATYLGHERENPVWLTSHDWIAEEGTPWNQALVRKALDDPVSTGYWNVHVVAAGEYEVRLRRWPRESGAAIDAALPPGADVPGDSPFRASPGRALAVVRASVQVGEVLAEAPVQPGAVESTLRMTLPAGKARMTARFTTRDGGDLGAFYAYVKRL